MSIKKRAISTSLLILDSRLQCREAVPESIIKEYEEAWREKVTFPPVNVFEVDGEYLVVDGFCRVLKDALRAACGANVSHGLRRTIADKRKAAKIAISEFPDETSRALAEMVGVSHTYIQNLRDQDKKIDQIIDQAAAGDVPDLVPQPKLKQKTKSVEEILDVISPPGWHCSDCGCNEQRLSDGGNVCRSCLCPVGEEESVDETEETIDESETKSVATFPDPIPEKMGAVQTAWGRFIRACEQAKCSPVLNAEIELITKKLKGLV
jgi:hypothetical protein